MLDKEAIRWMGHREIVNNIQATMDELNDLRNARRNGVTDKARLLREIQAEADNYAVLAAELQRRNTILLYQAEND